MKITEFLEARIAEDEALANYYGPLAMGSARVLAECAAKRAIVGLAASAGTLDNMQANLDYGYDNIEEEMLCTLAAVYADHPDYDASWAL